jgi:hypothetical protein
MPLSQRSILKPILLAGLIAGTLDMSDAVIFYYIRNHIPPIRIFQSIAGGLLGPAARAGGWTTAALGIALHYFIATCWAALFVVVARRVTALCRYAVPAGLLYGLFVYAVMNYVVLPLSHAPKSTGHPLAINLINAVCAIVFFIGLPISLINKRFA